MGWGGGGEGSAEARGRCDTEMAFKMRAGTLARVGVGCVLASRGVRRGWGGVGASADLSLLLGRAGYKPRSPRFPPSSPGLFLGFFLNTIPVFSLAASLLGCTY